MASKRRWWLKLEYGFFQDKKVKALKRRCGDSAPGIYQKIMLRSLQNDFRLKYDRIEDSFAEEIAEEIDENDKDAVSVIDNVLTFLLKHEMMIDEGNDVFYFPQAAIMSDSETEQAERTRNWRGRKKASQCDGETSQCAVITEETETEQKIELDTEQNTDTSAAASASVSASSSFPSASVSAYIGELQSICEKEHITASDTQMHKYCQIMAERGGWKDGHKKPIKKIGAHFRDWLKRYGDSVGAETETNPNDTEKTEIMDDDTVEVGLEWWPDIREHHIPGELYQLLSPDEQLTSCYEEYGLPQETQDLYSMLFNNTLPDDRILPRSSLKSYGCVLYDDYFIYNFDPANVIRREKYRNGYYMDEENILLDASSLFFFKDTKWETWKIRISKSDYYGESWKERNRYIAPPGYPTRETFKEV